MILTTSWTRSTASEGTQRILRANPHEANRESSDGNHQDGASRHHNGNSQATQDKAAAETATDTQHPTAPLCFQPGIRWRPLFSDQEQDR
mmetsp:Transcript_9888/g.26994  ORF Transcript_9888/g.26994 Transcript_9888/m.26994 type:complete len:90 (+) Transcript_9888:1203-1472(+)